MKRIALIGTLGLLALLPARAADGDAKVVDTFEFSCFAHPGDAPAQRSALEQKGWKALGTEDGARYLVGQPGIVYVADDAPGLHVETIDYGLCGTSDETGDSAAVPDEVEAMLKRAGVKYIIVREGQNPRMPDVFQRDYHYAFGGKLWDMAVATSKSQRFHALVTMAELQPRMAVPQDADLRP